MGLWKEQGTFVTLSDRATSLVSVGECERGDRRRPRRGEMHAGLGQAGPSEPAKALTRGSTP